VRCIAFTPQHNTDSMLSMWLIHSCERPHFVLVFRQREGDLTDADHKVPNDLTATETCMLVDLVCAATQRCLGIDLHLAEANGGFIQLYHYAFDAFMTSCTNNEASTMLLAEAYT
jgi:hypothetical protein